MNSSRVTRAADFRRVLPWINAALIVFALLAAAWFWILSVFEKNWVVPHGIYASAQLVNSYHVHRAQHGAWPKPGEYVAKDVAFVVSYQDEGTRVDVFDYGGQQFALVYVRQDSLEVHPVREWKSNGGLK